ncbi:hypothetical protein ABT214_33105, partial [Micromonospora purpureochromogenes]
MTSPLEDLIRTTLTDLAEEAPTVQDQLPPAERRARTRRRATVTMGAVGTLAAVLIAAPLAIAQAGSDARCRRGGGHVLLSHGGHSP